MGTGAWYQQAVMYEVFVRGFFDANDDGVGDLPGLTSKLDYLQWLGVDCLWLLPIYDSPLRDGGYDISDFFKLLPEYGNLEDFRLFIDQAHARGIRVVSDLVLNHTSDQHPWFQESRSNPNGPKGDWYIWADDDQRWPEARVIFSDVERSNWAWDPVRQQYYWHRFYSHQPDLNYENPEVQEAMLEVVRFWLDTGLDGFRLDAVPYLFQADGTDCENLPETHAFLRRLRKEVDATHPGKVLLAEANQWPTDVVDYFGDGDECHMCFHFPLMPRLFMAVRREQRIPVTEILAQTPEIPESCQWGLFLRNHDELTLEKVTDEERDYLYSEYAADPRMRRHMGIGRRLAPLVDNDRRVAELLYSLLLSLKGTPILYYGDEIMMGDNIYLGDRDGVRTPMQWTPDRNAGFSRADFAQLYLPPLMDPVYGYQAVNVEAYMRDRSSFLHWLRTMIATRRQHPVFGTGSLEMLEVDNPSVLGYVRAWQNRTESDSEDPAHAPPQGPGRPLVQDPGGAAAQGPGHPLAQGPGRPLVQDPGGAAAQGPGHPLGQGPARAVPEEVGQRFEDAPVGLEPSGTPSISSGAELVVCLFNLSRFPQAAGVDLSRFSGQRPYEMTGRVPFPDVGEGLWQVTFAPYGSYWLELRKTDQSEETGP